MTGQQLKNSILQMAVQGKLVPQDPNDEPASVLLERIRKEKEHLIKEGKIKKEKNPSYIFRGADNLPYEKVGKNEPVCIADEVPFDIPESWEWVRLSNVFSVINGDRGKNYPAKSTLSKTGIPFISALNLDGKTVVEDDNLLCLSDEQFNKLGNGKLEKDDVVVCIRGSLGKHGRYPFEKGAIASSLVILRPHMNIPLLSDFIMMYLDSPVFFSEIKKYDNGTAQPNLAAKSLEMFFVPFPPLNEQDRILQKLAVVSPSVDEYQTDFSKLTVLNDTFSNELKKSILQEAVQGKLVPQDPADEPASVLLERIRAEKEQLIKDGKIKRDKHESIIFRRDNSHYEKRGSEEVCIDDEIPFDIPENWCWSRLSTLCKSISDGDHQPPPQVPFGIPFVVISDVSSGKIDLGNTRFVPQDYYRNLHESRIPCRDDILFTVTGSYGIVIPVDIDDAFCFQRHIALLKPLRISTQFLSTWLETPVVYEQCEHCATGTAQKTVGLNSLKNILVPIPPANEQVRVLERLRKVLPSITL